MKKSLIAATTTAFVLVACGYGYSPPPGTTTPTATSTPSGPIVIPTGSPPVDKPVITNPAPVTTNPIVIGTTGNSFLLNPLSGANVTVSGDGNKIDISDYVGFGVVQISGNGNIIVFGKGVTLQSITVTGLRNQFWVPSGTFFGFGNAADTSNTIQAYTPK